MSNLLIVILLTKSRLTDWGSLPGLWKSVQEVIRASTGPDVAHESSTAAAPELQATVFRSLTSASQPVDSSSEPPGNKLRTDETAGGSELLGVFLETSLQEESVFTSLFEGLRGLTQEAIESSPITNLDCRLYRSYSQLSSGELMPTGQGTLVINCMTPSAESEAAFNEWYAEEHIPMLSAVPGWCSSKRYILVDSKRSNLSTTAVGTAGVPKYLALHEWMNDDIFQTTGYSFAIDTPWRTEVMRSVQEKQRFVLKYIGRLEEELVQ